LNILESSGIIKEISLFLCHYFSQVVKSTMNKLIKLLYSTRLMATLFIVFATAMGLATFIENDYGTETAKALVYNSWWFEAIMLLLAINFFGNIFRYKLYRREKWVVLVFHLAFLLIILGAGVTRYISHEGIMPIKEGETTNRFLSEKNYLEIVINNGKEQKTPFRKPLLLSALGKNHFVYQTEFRGTPVVVEMTDYIPNAIDVFEETDQGVPHLLLVEASGGNRHEHYIKKGTSELIHGVLIGFDAPNRNTIDINSVGDSLTINSSVEGSFFRMADNLRGKIAKDSVQKLSLLTLHQLAGLQFVIPKSPVKGLYKTLTGDAETATLAQLEFEVRVADEVKKIPVKGGKFAIQQPSQFSVGALNFTMSYGAMQKELPFSIKLNDFQLDTYPGSSSPMSYASELTVIDPEKTFDFRVFMNNILRFRGYKFFQSSYQITEQYEETHLSVNYDFWGTTLTYIGYFLLYAGLLLNLFIKGTRFDQLRKSLRKILLTKKVFGLAALLLLSTGIQAQQHNHPLSEQQIDSVITATRVSPEHADKFAKLVIQDAGGRMKPVHTYASELLRKLSKHDTFKGLNATQVLLSLQQNPRTWFRMPIIYLEKGNDKLREMIGVSTTDKYANLADFFDEKGAYKIGEAQQKAHQKNIKSKFEKDLINVDRRVNLLYSALMGEVLRFFPVPNDPNNSWVAHNNLPASGFKGQDSVFVRQIMPIYLQTLTKACTENNYTEADQLVEGIAKFQRKFGAAVHPGAAKIDLEINYNKYDVFRKLFSYYMYIGTLMFLFVIAGIFQQNTLLRWLVRLSGLLIVGLFLLHTGGLIARWVISDHAPWSNAYESMIYVGWATMLFGLIFGRKSSITLAATAFLTAFILMVAHWNWMDPEIENLVPVLNSYWLMIHVAIIVASYGPFALGMLLGLIALVLMIFTNRTNQKKIDRMLKEITVINEMSLTVGLVLLTIGNFLGGQWANESWGRYWGWDPKETWALISIMVYAFVLHARLVPGLRGRYTFNLLSVIAFASILMTYFGVNFYLSGLHSYASGDQAITPGFVYYTTGIVTVIALIALVQYKKHYKK